MTDILNNKDKKVEEYKDEGKEEDESIDDEEINMANAELANIYDEEIILIDKESSGEDDTEQNKDIFKKTDDKDNKNKNYNNNKSSNKDNDKTKKESTT